MKLVAETLDGRNPLRGEHVLWERLEEALTALVRCQSAIELHATEELVWGNTRIPQARQGEQS